MRIVKKETVYLSLNEMDAFSEVIRIMEGVERTATSPNLKTGCEVTLNIIKDFLENDCEIMDEDVFNSEEDFPLGIL